MARVPVLEAAYGQDRLARIHRVVGFTSFNLMFAHIVAITWGYALGDIAASARDPVEPDASTTPACCSSVAGTACLVMVVVTSVKAARRRLRYESWHLMHLYAYLGVGLALPHQLWTGQEFMSSPDRHRLLVDRWGRRRRRPCSSGGSASAVPQYLRHQLRVTSVVPRGADVVPVSVSPGAPGPAARPRPASSSPGASWAGPGWSRPPLLAVRGARTAAACGSPSGPLGDGSAATSAASGPAPACWSRTATGGLANGPARRRGSPADRRRRRHHAAARWPRACRTRPGDAGARAAYADAAAVRRRVRRPRRRAWPAGGGVLAAAAPPTRGSASWPRRTSGAAPLGAGHRRARRLRLRPAGLDRRGPPTSRAAGLPGEHLHVETFGW